MLSKHTNDAIIGLKNKAKMSFEISVTKSAVGNKYSCGIFLYQTLPLHVFVHNYLDGDIASHDVRQLAFRRIYLTDV
jgi:hypothetical protein